MSPAQPERMRAAVYHGPGEIRTEDVMVPTVGPGDVLLGVNAVGICGSDLHVYRSGLYGAEPGRIMGHEFSGTAVAVGSEVEGVELGQRFTGFTISYCGRCYWCEHGQYRLCPHLFEGYTGYGKPGAMAEYVLIENAVVGQNLLPIPAGMSDEVAAMAEPLGTAVYTTFRLKPQAGDTVVVIGAGMIGNLVLQALKAMHDVRVIVTEVSPERAELAREVGADLVIDATRADLLDAVMDATGHGRYIFGESGMADIVVDAAAAPPTFNQALAFVRSKGTVGIIGSAEEPGPADVSLIMYKDVRVVGIFGSSIPHGLELLDAQKVTIDPLISHRFELGEADEAFAAAADPSSLKVLLLPT